LGNGTREKGCKRGFWAPDLRNKMAEPAKKKGGGAGRTPGQV